MLKRKYIIITSCLLIATGLVYKTIDKGTNTDEKKPIVKVSEKKEIPIKEIAAVETISDYVSESDIKGLTRVSDIIVMGRFLSLDYDTMNTNQDPDRPVDNGDYAEGRVFKFQVDKVMKGNVPSVISVGQTYFERTKIVEDNAVIENSIIIKPATKQEISTFDILNPAFVQPELNKDYILFLNDCSDTSVYFSASRAFMIIFENEQATFLTNADAQEKLGIQKFKKRNGKEIEMKANFGGAIQDTISGKAKDEVILSIQDAVH